MPRLASVVSRHLFVLASVTVLAVVAAPAVAQEVVREAPAHISLVEGAVVLERDGQVDRAPSSMPLLAGDRVRTQIGRGEILFADNSTLHLDNHTVVDFQSDDVIRLLEGRVRINIVGAARDLSYRVDAPSAWVEIRTPGEYRVAIVGGDRGREVELAVLRGAAELVNEDGVTALRAGERAFAAADSAPSQPYVFNSAAWDTFDRWSEARRDTRLGLSAQYLPPEVRPYASSFDSNGSWQYQASYGYVWYPQVAVGWRPYYHGRWHHVQPYGWTWIGADPWAWPTHHYGRWGFSAGSWFWIPGKQWGAAWVSWGYAPGYVSWCPLGWNNLPVYGFSSIHYRANHYGPWHAWTVVPHGRFGHGYVNVNVVNVNNLDVRTRTAFTERRTPPEIRGYAIPRASAPIRLAGSRAVSPGATAAPAAQLSSPGVAGRETPRARGSVSSSSERPGFPAPARAPRPSAFSQPGERAQPRSEGTVRTQPADRPSAASGGTGGVRAAPRAGNGRSGDAPAAAQPGRTAPPRATPRAGSPQAQSPSSSGGTAQAPATSPPASAAPAPSARPRAVPRAGGVGESYTPSSSAYRQTPRTYPTPSAATPYRSARPDSGGREAVVPYAVPDRSMRRPPAAGPRGSSTPPPSYAPPPRTEAPRSYAPPPSRGEGASRPAPGPASAPSAAQPRSGSGGTPSAPSRGGAGGTAPRGTARSRGGN
jgi:hypothetical protein